MNQTFPSDCRLHTPSEFARALRRRGLVRGVLLELCVVANAAGVPRLGIVVPKRLARHAVVRNTIKRVVREGFRCARTLLPKGDYVFRLYAMTGDRDELAGLRRAVAADVGAALARVVET